MKITAILGTNRKKYTYKMVQLFDEEFRKYENAEFEYVFLSGLNLQHCIGCGICKDDETLCVLKDDAAGLKDKLLDSDLIIFASPVYENFISGYFKNFIDRFHYLSFRNLLCGKFSIVLSTSSYSGLKISLDYLHLFSGMCGINLAGRLGVLIPKFFTDDRYKKNVSKKMRNIVKRYFEMKGKRTKPGLTDLVIFNDQKKRIKLLKDKYRLSYRYWEEKGWLKMNYFSDARINPVAAILAKLLRMAFSRN